LALEESEADMYADDSSITAQAETVPELEQKLTKDAEIISQWCFLNRMTANIAKTKVMLITTWQKRAALPEHLRTLRVKMNSHYLENVTTERLLGALINNKLSWESHINSAVSKVNSKLALLRRIKGCLPLVSRKIFSLIWTTAPLCGVVHPMLIIFT
jgi:hypothetical protein